MFNTSYLFNCPEKPVLVVFDLIPVPILQTGSRSQNLAEAVPGLKLCCLVPASLPGSKVRPDLRPEAQEPFTPGVLEDSYLGKP